ncbi:hypothetical protein IW261DRAFT_1558784 [Armillaria novae-zelandiae]|uniref:Uncharacterized protein n=1 Tax=Armillaria novae-zelandiae TaxID=153914 RepID=A0AA39PNS4_9AGAR|nr:hypothetical protein IW261DRAFT_1558784 [Armillaria novae-zelandiae]
MSTMDPDPVSMGWPALGSVPNFDLEIITVEPLPDAEQVRDHAAAKLGTTTPDTDIGVGTTLPLVTAPRVEEGLSSSQVLHTQPVLMLVPVTSPSTVTVEMSSPLPSLPVSNMVLDQVPPSTSTRGLSRSQASQVWKDHLAARAREKDLAKKGKGHNFKGSDQGNYDSLGLRLPVRGETVAAHRERMSANEGSLVGAVVDIRDRFREYAAEHTESHELVLQGLSDLGVMVQQTSDVAHAMAKVVAPLTDAVNCTMGAVQTMAGAMNSHTLTLQTHSTAIQSMCTGIQDIDIGLTAVHESINGMQTHLSALSNPSPSPAPALLAGNNSLICTQHPSNPLPPPKRPRGNGTRSGNHGRASNLILCPPLMDIKSQTVVFTVTQTDQDPIETSRCVAAAIPGVGAGAIAHVRQTSVVGSTLLQFRSLPTARAFVHLLCNCDSVMVLGASAGFAAYTPPGQTTQTDNGIANVLNILSHPVQGN